MLQLATTEVAFVVDVLTLSRLRRDVTAVGKSVSRSEGGENCDHGARGKDAKAEEDENSVECDSSARHGESSVDGWRAGGQDGGENDSENSGENSGEEELFSSLRYAVSRLMQCANVIKLGFSSQGDLDRLEQSLPGSTVCSASTIDLQPLARMALGKRSGGCPGLRQACSSMLSVDLDKSEQTSDWEQRPLTTAQLAYAATDAAILPALYKALQYALAMRIEDTHRTTGLQPKTAASPIPRSPPSTTSAGTLAVSGAPRTRPLLSSDLPLNAQALVESWLSREVREARGGRLGKGVICEGASTGG